MYWPLSQTSWAKRSHLSQRQSLTYVLEHKTVAYFFEFFSLIIPGCIVHKKGRLHKIHGFEASMSSMNSMTSSPSTLIEPKH